MHIKKLKLCNYRNYINTEIRFKKGLNVIYGDNAQGKTNVIESVFLCATGRSHKTTRDEELIRNGENGFYINLEFEREIGSGSIEITSGKNEKKRVKKNEIPVKKIGELIGFLNAVIFSPEDIIIIKEGPSERRRMIDMTMCQIKPSYFYDLQQYMKVIKQRNSLLKELQTKRSLIDTLDVWNKNLIKIGSRIVKERNNFIEKLNKYAEVNHERITGGKEALCIKYEPSVVMNKEFIVSNIEEKFEKLINEKLEREIINGSTLVGPHRDDYKIFINGLDVKTYGSQGQQRTAVLSVKLSEIDIMKEESGEYPVLLLDDVMSELDEKRKEFLIKSIVDVQTFITSTDKKIIENEKFVADNYIRVEKGNVFFDSHT